MIPKKEVVPIWNNGAGKNKKSIFFIHAQNVDEAKDKAHDWKKPCPQRFEEWCCFKPVSKGDIIKDEVIDRDGFIATFNHGSAW